MKNSTTRLSLAGCLISALVITSVEAADTRNMTIDQRLSRLERTIENQNLVDMFRHLQNLQREIEQIRGELEVLSHNINSMKQRQKDLYVDLDNRIQQVEMAANSMGGGAPTGDLGMGDFGASSDSGMVDGTPVSEEEAYQQGLNLLRDRKFKEAVEQFKIVLVSFPNGDYSDNAQYWLGEANYVMRDFSAAVVEFAKVISQYPHSTKMADAHLKIGFSYYELEQYKKAKTSLDRVLKDFPNTTAARLAQSRLRQMKLQGKIK